MPQICIVGEAWGEAEERERAPFVGAAGYELTRMLDEAGIRRADCFLTNVFNLRPGPKNDIETLCVPATGSRLAGWPALRAGKYISNEYMGELERLYRELAEVQPNLIIALGNTASWAILKNAGISKIRGAVAASSIIGDRTYKTLPTYHPAAVLRQWDLRPVTVLDLMKARRESEFPEIRRPQRTVYIEPELHDLEWFYDRYLRQAKIISVDIETMADQITCIGFAPTVDVALVVPFVDNRRGGNYWPDFESELRAWEFVRQVLASSTPKLFQNGLYDMHFLWRRYGIPTVNATHDTMLLHHALYPELEKGLGFLGSVYTNEASWKLMRKGSETIKRDE
jgi:uracil-DNA glycosylase